MRLLLLAAVGVAFVSRVAKNFQDYFVNVITQRLGAQLYSDGIRHSLELPYQVFEDQRSGETLGKLQKVRTDVERLISAAINVLFTTLVGVVFVMIYAFTRALVDRAGVSDHGAAARGFQLGAEPRIKEVQKTIVAETTALAGVDHRVAAQHRAGQEPGAGAAGDRAPERHHRKDPEARAARRCATCAA